MNTYFKEYLGSDSDDLTQTITFDRLLTDEKTLAYADSFVSIKDQNLVSLDIREKVKS